MRRTDDPPNRTSSPFRVHAPGLQSSIVCIRPPAPSGLTRLVFRKTRNWDSGIGPINVAPRVAVGVDWRRSELAALCRRCSTVDQRRWFLPVHSRRPRLWRFFHHRAGSPPKHLGPSRERSDYGQRRDRKQYPCHVSTSISLLVSS